MFVITPLILTLSFNCGDIICNQPKIEYKSPIVYSPLKTNNDLLNDLHEEITYKILAEQILRQ